MPPITGCLRDMDLQDSEGLLPAEGAGDEVIDLSDADAPGVLSHLGQIRWS
jgi:hypothetical protein